MATRSVYLPKQDNIGVNIEKDAPNCGGDMS